MKESSVNVTLGVGEIVKEVKDTKTIEEVDKTSALCELYTRHLVR